MEDQPRWSAVLRILREARGVTQDGWAARLGVSRATVQRWESGERAPDPSVEEALLAHCQEAGLLRRFDRGPLAGLSLTSESLRDLLSEGRLDGSDRSATSPPERRTPAEAGLPRGAGPAIHPGAAERAESNPRASNLPAALTSFIGRQQEIAALRRVLGGTRLLTLTGVGGCGKTRLALELAGELLWAYPHGVWFTDLAALGDPTLVPQTVAAALSLRPGEHPILDALREQLAARHLLLILDNCEHLLDACATLVETLLRACPHIEILTTSREPLGIAGETVWRVPPLSLPEGGDREQVTGGRGQGTGDEGGHAGPPRRNPGVGADLRVRPDVLPTQSAVLPPEAGLIGSPQSSSEAVQLFVERARQYRPDFALLPGNQAAVEQICRRLDGIPLAIELAAARVSALSVEQIASRLADRFRLLTGGSRTALPRHQTLHATLEWSHDLLTPAEQTALRRLAVFAGGFTLEAAEEVIAERGQGIGDSGQGTGGIAQSSVLDLLTHLVDKSLVVAEVRGGEARYRMLETVRQYAEEKLVVAGEAEAMRDRHATWCLALAEAAENYARGPEQAAWLERLAAQYGNLRAALRWCLSDEHDLTLGLRLAGRLLWFWEARGDLAEGRSWLAALLAQGNAAPPDARCTALDAAGVLARNQGDLAAAVRLHEQSIALARELDDEALIARTVNNLAIAVAWEGDLIQAEARFEESLALEQKLGNRWGVAVTLMDLGNVAADKDEPERAVTLYEESLALSRELGDRRLVATLLQNLGNRYRARGAWDLAAAHYRDGLSVYRELQDRIGILRCLRIIAHLALDRGDPVRAARLCGAAAALRAAHGVAFTTIGDAAFERTRATACAELGEVEFAVAWAAGQAMSQEEAIEEALAATSDRELPLT